MTFFEMQWTTTGSNNESAGSNIQDLFKGVKKTIFMGQAQNVYFFKVTYKINISIGECT